MRWPRAGEGKGEQAKIRKFCHMHPLAPLQRGPWLSLARTVVELGKRFPNYAQGTGWPQHAQEGADRAVDGPSASGRRTPHLVATSVPGRMLERALAQNH